MKYPALGGVPIYIYIYIIYIYIYIYICGYIRLYNSCVDPKMCILGVWTCILGVWTCIWVSGLVFWVSTHHPVVYDPACGAFFFWKMTPLDFLNTYIVNLVNFHQFEVPLVFFSKSGQSVQMAMPARRASIFCSRSRSQCPNLFFPDPESW